MANLTITVDDAVLKRARVRAVRRNESVNSYLAEVLKRYADEGESPIDAILADSAESQASSGPGGRTWTRDELYRD